MPLDGGQNAGPPFNLLLSGAVMTHLDVYPHASDGALHWTAGGGLPTTLTGP